MGFFLLGINTFYPFLFQIQFYPKKMGKNLNISMANIQ